MIAEPWDTAGYQVGGFPAGLVGVERQVPRRRPRASGPARTACSAPCRSASSAAPTCTRATAARRPPASASSPPTTGSPWPTSPSYNEKHNERQRRGQQRRRERQQVVQQRRRGPDRRPGRQRAPRPGAAQLPGHPAAVGRRADDPRRRRDRPHPGRQQQRLLPGQRDLLVPLGRRRRRPARVHPDADRAAPDAPGAAAAVVPAGARRRRHRLGARCCARTARSSPTRTGTTPRPAASRSCSATRARDAFALLLNAAENGVEFTVPEAPTRSGSWRCRATRPSRSRVR